MSDPERCLAVAYNNVPQIYGLGSQQKTPKTTSTSLHSFLLMSETLL